MADPGSVGHVFRRAFSWLPAQFASQSDAPVGAPRQFRSTEHLSIEAIAAFVDGELRMNAHLRAAHHLSLCAQCAAEVDDQSRAPRRSARFPPDPHPQHVARITVRDPALST
ncbi:ECF subfamily RNA polymerase sigma-70 factor [Mycobacterium tuberculosis]|nr:ECF subfamily RNA polymerase sigma-70 factor [Mycobacterium tuberculosis]